MSYVASDNCKNSPNVVFDSYKAAVNTFSALDSQVEYGPTFDLEYGTRETYGANIPWGDNDPLNATWWQLVTERASYDRSLTSS